MEKILIILIVLLFLAIAVLFLVVKSKQKKDKEEIKIVKEEPVIDLSSTMEANKVENLSNIESLDDEFEKTREQTEVIEIIESMQEKAKNITERVADYEDEQEENAIISYTELLNAVKNKKEVQEELNFEEIKNEVPNEGKKETVEIKPFNEEKKFHSSEAISPLGRINKNIADDSYRSNRNPENMQNEEFLNSLKNFRDNL